MFHRALRPAKLWRRTFQIDSWTGWKRVYQRRWLPSRGKSWNKVLAETHESLRWTSGCVGSSFWLHISHFLLFLLAPSAPAPRGVPAVPWMWRPAVALQFREARPVSVISLREMLLLEAKPSFLTWPAEIQSSACLYIDNLLDPELKKRFSGCTVAVLTHFTICKSDAFLAKWVKLFQKKTIQLGNNFLNSWISYITHFTSWLRFESKKTKRANNFGVKTLDSGCFLPLFFSGWLSPWSGLCGRRGPNGPRRWNMNRSDL